MPLLLDDSIGAERLQLAIFKTAYAEINAYLATQQATGQALDVEFETVTQRGLVPATLEPFQPRDIHYGHRPSMIEAPATRYPSMSIMAYRAAPSASNQTVDYGHSFQLSCAIECIVKAGPYEYTTSYDPGPGEELVGRRIKRTAEAVHALMLDNAAIGGLFMPPETLPNIIWGDIFIRDDDIDGVTRRYLWQGVRMEYTYLKQTINN